MKLKIYADSQFLQEGKPHNILLCPFWGPYPEVPGDPSAGRFDRYKQMGSSYFTLTSLDESDLAVAPNDWISGEENASILLLAEMANRLGKPVVIFFNHDSSENIDVPGSVIFRTSFYRSTRKPNEFAFPAWSEDFITQYYNGVLPLRSKKDRPTVGFCGYAASSFDILRDKVARLNRLKGKKSEEIEINGHILRSQALKALSEDRQVQTNFLIRKKFLGGAINSKGKVNLRKLQRARLEYVQNLIQSDYTICVRGTGNFSYRLYETICSGRIPLFIDTDCVLPFDHLIDWKRYVVWVSPEDIPEIGERVADFHSSLSNTEFLELQQECRRLWNEWVSPEGFFSKFYLHFGISLPSFIDPTDTYLS